MFRALWKRPDVTRLSYVHLDRGRWGVSLRREQVDAKVEVARLPRGVPFDRFGPMRWMNRHIHARLIRGLAAEAEKSALRVVYWFYDWFQVRLVDQLPRAATVMELTDSVDQMYAARPDVMRRIPGLKARVRESADLVFSVSEPLAAEARGGRARTTVLANGISSEFLAEATRSHEEPQALRGMPQPRLCVVGTNWSLNNRLDHALLRSVVERLDRWHLVIIGCDQVQSAALRSLVEHPRVHVLPMMPHHLLIPFIQHSDLCAVPYAKGPARGDSLKTYEYLACGKPVVLTADEVIPEIRPYVRHAASADEFIAIARDVERGIGGSDARAVLAGLTWDARAGRCMAELSGVPSLS